MPLFLTVAGDLGGCWGNVSDSCKKKREKRKGGKEILIIAVQMSSPVEDSKPFFCRLGTLGCPGTIGVPRYAPLFTPN